MTYPEGAAFFTADLAQKDKKISDLLAAESERQMNHLEFIASKNYMSRAVYEAHSSIVALTSVEGYPGRRMHAGMQNLDEIELLAVERARELFRCSHANVQAHSGTQANQAVFFALLEPGDPVVSMAIRAGGHLSHGLRSNFSGRWFRAFEYGVRPDGIIDYDETERVVRARRPKLVIAGGSSYPRVIDFARLREIADMADAYLLADIAHISGLVVSGYFQNPFPYAHIVTTTTNKNLRGPRGGLILCDDADLAKRIDRAIFPGIQGGPLPEMICAKSVAFREALSPSFRMYAEGTLRNARAMAAVLAERGYQVVTGGTDTPLVLVDLRDRGITGAAAERALEAACLPCNRNLVPGDPQKPAITSGLRFGSSAVTTRGLGEADVAVVTGLIADVLDSLEGDDPSPGTVAEVAREVAIIAQRFPLYKA